MIRNTIHIAFFCGRDKNKEFLKEQIDISNDYIKCFIPIRKKINLITIPFSFICAIGEFCVFS